MGRGESRSYSPGVVPAIRRKERTIASASTAPIISAGTLKIDDVSKRFGSVAAVDHVSLEIREGEFVCILGPSGCGKTTLLRLIAGLEHSTGGSLFLNDRDITRTPPALRNCGIVFQSYALFPNLNAFQNIAYGLRDLARKEREARVREWLEWVGLAHCADRRPSQLSGGQQQRVALARALAPQPSVLLLDEPLSALDAKVRHQLRTQIRDLQRQLGITTIMVTHDQLEAMTMAERIVVMKDGAVLQVGSPSDLYHRPADPFVADFLGSMNFIQARVTSTTQASASGLVFQLERPLPGSTGDSLTLAIRPEDLRMGPDKDCNTFPARIVDREFRGSHYRMTLALLSSIPDEEPITVELEASGEHATRLTEGGDEEVRIEFPPDRILAFGTPVG